MGKLIKKVVRRTATSDGSETTSPTLAGRLTSYSYTHGLKISIPGTYSTIEVSASATVDSTGLTEDSQIQQLLSDLHDTIHEDVERQIKEKLDKWRKLLAQQRTR